MSGLVPLFSHSTGARSSSWLSAPSLALKTAHFIVYSLIAIFVVNLLYFIYYQCVLWNRDVHQLRLRRELLREQLRLLASARALASEQPPEFEEQRLGELQRHDVQIFGRRTAEIAVHMAGNLNMVLANAQIPAEQPNEEVVERNEGSAEQAAESVD